MTGGGGDGARPPVVVAPDGCRHAGPLGADAQVALWGRCLHAGTAGLVEVAVGVRRADGLLAMRSRSRRGRYPDAGDLGALVALASRHRRLGE